MTQSPPYSCSAEPTICSIPGSDVSIWDERISMQEHLQRRILNLTVATDAGARQLNSSWTICLRIATFRSFITMKGASARASRVPGLRISTTAILISGVRAPRIRYLPRSTANSASKHLVCRVTGFTECSDTRIRAAHSERYKPSGPSLSHTNKRHAVMAHGDSTPLCNKEQPF